MTDAFNNFIQAQDLCECQHDKMFTFRSASNHCMQSQIDFILGPKMIMADMYQYQYWTSLSDHSALVLRERSLTTQGPGQWHFAEDLLDNDMILHLIKQVIDSFDKEDPQQSWEVVKVQIKNISQ